MGFADELAELKIATQGPRCNVAIIQDDMTPSDVAEMEAALADPFIPDSAVLRVLKGRGHEAIKLGSVSRHRRRQCACPPWEAAAG